MFYIIKNFLLLNKLFYYSKIYNIYYMTQYYFNLRIVILILIRYKLNI